MRLIEDGGSLAVAFAGGKPTRPVSKPLSDIAGRLAWMAKQGIDKQVVGGWVDMFGYELPGAEAEAWSRLANDCTARGGESRAAFRAAGDRAAGRWHARRRRAEGGGDGGVSRRHDRHAAARGRQHARPCRSRPVLAGGGRNGAFIHIHPSFDAGDVRVNDFGLANGLGRITDAAVAVARLISAGHVAKYKNAKFFAPMGAAALPFVLGRLKRNAAITPGIGDPVAGLAAIYTDTILHDARVLKFVIEMMGTERLMMGSDMPFPIGDTEPMKIVAAAGLSKAQTDSINGGLAARLLRIQ